MILVKVPGINGLGKTQGMRNSGNAILKELTGQIEEIHVNNQNIEEQEKLIYDNSLEFFRNQDKVIFLGGDHSISYSTGRAFLDFCKNKGREAFFIVFDAHADCMEPMREPTNEEWLRALIEKGLKPENVILVGVRKIDDKEKDFLERSQVKQIPVEEIKNNIDEVIKEIIKLGDNRDIYISIDIDVLDPEFALSTAHKEQGGLGVEEMIQLVGKLAKLENLKAVDLVEIDSEQDVKKDWKTVRSAAKILKEFS